MNNVLGIIAEYNPFHNGHLYHLIESKKVTNSDYTIAVISGNFTQRGIPSIVNKWQKTKMALNNGVDLIIELPTLYSISSAENFADGAVKILNSLGIVNHISFGAETEDIKKLDLISNILYSESIEYKGLLSKELDKGLSYPKARENALITYLNDDGIKDIISSPNNILGIEYLKALKKYNSDIHPISILRNEVDHNDDNISNSFASSTKIRELIKNNDLEQLKYVIPDEVYNILEENNKDNNIVNGLGVFENEILYNLRKMSIEQIAELPDVCEGLEYAIKNASNEVNSINELIDKIKSKRYIQTRIQRILLYILLDITKKDMEIAKNNIPYIRVLGFNNKGKELISEITKKNPNIKIITSVKKFVDENKNNSLKTLLDKDILATNIYSLKQKNNYEGNLDYKNKIIE